jgi:GxxExxY protein
VHKDQIRTYLKASNLEVGLLLNFKVEHLRDGIHRINA